MKDIIVIRLNGFVALRIRLTTAHVHFEHVVSHVLAWTCWLTDFVNYHVAVSDVIVVGDRAVTGKTKLIRVITCVTIVAFIFSLIFFFLFNLFDLLGFRFFVLEVALLENIVKLLFTFTDLHIYRIILTLSFLSFQFIIRKMNYLPKLIYASLNDTEVSIEQM